MQTSKQKSAAAERDAKHRLENPLTEAKNDEKIVVEAERQQKIRQTAEEKCERLRAKAERRCVAGLKGLAVEATRKSSRHKCQATAGR
jgi:hypothetical protein